MSSVGILRKIFYFLQVLSDEVRGVDFISGVASRHVEYAATIPFAYSILKSYFRDQKIDEKDAIIDVGCGKGRMLVFFSKFPFGKFV